MDCCNISSETCLPLLDTGVFVLSWSLQTLSIISAENVIDQNGYQTILLSSISMDNLKSEGSVVIMILFLITQFKSARHILDFSIVTLSCAFCVTANLSIFLKMLWLMPSCRRWSGNFIIKLNHGWTMVVPINIEDTRVAMVFTQAQNTPLAIIIESRSESWESWSSVIYTFSKS